MMWLSAILEKLLHYFLKMNDCKPPLGDCDCHENQEFQLSDGINVHLGSGDEINRDILLTHNPYQACCTLSGIVKDNHGCSIENALVKVFDSSHHPVAHVFTNKEGQFLICIAPGNYILKAVR